MLGVFRKLRGPKKLMGAARRMSTGEYTEKPEYPPIVSLTEEEKEQNRLHENYKKLNTVEEKLFALNMPRYYGWKCVMLKEGEYPYEFLDFVRYVTRTRLVRPGSGVSGGGDSGSDGVPDSGGSPFHSAQLVSREECDEIASRLSPNIKEAVLYNLVGRRWRHELEGSDVKMSDGDLKTTIAKSVVEGINSIIVTNLSSYYPHLLDSMVDYDPRLEASWCVGGFHPSEEVYLERERKDDKATEEEKNAPVEHWLQYKGRPMLQVRSTLPLNALNSQAMEGTEGQSQEVDQTDSRPNHDPGLAFKLETERRHVTNIPGFWPGDEHEYPLLSYHSCCHLMDRPPHFGPVEAASTIEAQAILASFAWLHASASYQGFSTFNEITYPLTTQTVVTDGRNFSAFLYQLNTMLFFGNNITSNPRVNLCLAQPARPLYQRIDGTQFVGWDDSVLSTLVSFYINVPQERVGIKMKPYLHPDEHHCSQIAEDERRGWLHNQFRHMYSNRPRHRLPYEIYDWERIYKIRFETRPGEARMRPFERDENPLEDRKYFQHMHKYIPKSVRPKKKHWTGWRAKFEKTYYPKV